MSRFINKYFWYRVTPESYVKATKSVLVKAIFGVFEYADQSNCLDRYKYDINMPRIIFSERERGKNIHLITTCCRW